MSAAWLGHDLPPIRRGGREYVLLGRGEDLYLILNQCPHRGAPLKFGFINADDAIVCPLHGGAFSIESLIARPTTLRLIEQETGQ